jgi:hypothetical protein
VVAELALDRVGGRLALLQRRHRLAELRHVGVGLGEVEVAAILGRAGVLAVLARQLVELRTLLQLRQQRLGFLFPVHQDVAGAVLGAAGLGLELVVLGLGVGVGDRILLAVVLEQSTSIGVLTALSNAQVSPEDRAAAA